MTILECVKQRKLIAIVRGVDCQKILRLGQALIEGGIGLMEITYQQNKPETWADTAKAIASVKKQFGDQMLVGAGTVISLEQVRMTYDAGGQYLVTPVVQTELIRAGKALSLGIFPGAMTPSEILNAYLAGADAVKVFPAGDLGPDYIKAIRAPLSHVPLLAVGGVNEKNAVSYLQAGCVGLGVGGNLVNKNWIANGEWEKITGLAASYVKAVQAV